MTDKPIQPELMASVAVVNVNGLPYLEYNVNGLRDAFPISLENVADIQMVWTNDLFQMRSQREVAQTEGKQAEEDAENTPKTEEKTEVEETVTPVEEIALDEESVEQGWN